MVMKVRKRRPLPFIRDLHPGARLLPRAWLPHFTSPHWKEVTICPLLSSRIFPLPLAQLPFFFLPSVSLSAILGQYGEIRPRYGQHQFEEVFMTCYFSDLPLCVFHPRSTIPRFEIEKSMGAARSISVLSRRFCPTPPPPPPPPPLVPSLFRFSSPFDGSLKFEVPQSRFYLWRLFSLFERKTSLSDFFLFGRRLYSGPIT